MKNAEAIRRRIEEVKELGNEDIKKALCMLAEISYDIGTDACDERKILQVEVDRLRKFIIGNGDPENSIMARLKGLEKSFARFTDKTGADIELIKNSLLGDLTGEKKGLNDRVADNTRINKNLNKVMWAVILIVLGEAVARILGLF